MGSVIDTIGERTLGVSVPDVAERIRLRVYFGIGVIVLFRLS